MVLSYSMPYSTSEKQRKYHRAWYQKNKDKRKKQIYKANRQRIADNKNLVIDYLKVHPCVDCSESNIIVLEFDHTEDNKTMNVCTMVASSYSWKTIEKEIEKCDVVCANCHRIRTAERGGHYRTLV